MSGKTLADSISVSLPRDGAAAVSAIKKSKGFAVTVSDREILAAIPAVARGANVFAEPAGRRLRGPGQVRRRRDACAPTTARWSSSPATALKDVASAMKVAGRPHEVGTGMDSVRRLVARENIL